MPRRRTLVPILLLAAPLFAQSLMPLSEVRAGMKGYGKTVFQGGKIERFEFEVLGVQRNATPGGSRIIVKCSGGPLAESGIIAGMSGSPCYVDGKLVGALSSGFAFEKDPVGGITPIQEMLDQLKDVPEQPGKGTPLVLPKLGPPIVIKSAMQGEMIPLSAILGAPEPNELPLPVSGAPLGPQTRSLWEGLPVQFLAAPALAPDGNAQASPLEPGGMVAINLVQGDLDLTAAGTITYAQGKKLLLFGHPLFNLGSVDLPLWSASVATVLSSYATSMKLATPVEEIGALREDRACGVAAVLGADAHMIPMRVGLNLGGRRTVNFRYEIMDHPLLTPQLAATVLSQTLESQVRGTGFQSLSLQGNIKLVGQDPIQIDCVVADLNAARVSAFVGGMLQAVCFNPFEKPVFDGISLTVKAEEKLDLAGVVGVRVLKGRVRPGDTLPIVVTLQNVQGVRETATLNIPVPGSARPGKATLMVGDGLSLMAADPDQQSIQVANLSDIVRLLNSSLRNNHAYAVLVQDDTGVGLRGGRIEGLPPSVANLVADDGGSDGGALKHRIIGRSVLPLDREVRGLASMDLEIEID
ncbi:MAG TPA: SpoIVB peptidase S55 domain-containing protein [Holophagaceae bacterium]|nr:SpoIVB peptidase S55 domain-containing protein [Holophagaceae bacterium]